MDSDTDQCLAGVDGCRAGWIVALAQPGGGDVLIRVVPHFAGVIRAPEQPAVIAVDMPIGLPSRIGPGGRGPEEAVRPLLGQRQSSVFSVPSRSAIQAATFAEACDRAEATSEPPRKVSKQLFNIAPKIREIDRVLRTESGVAGKVYEVHPELAFWRLNGERALDEPKKVKGQLHPPGLALRRRLLISAGLPESAVEAAPPVGASADDLLDTLACLAIARRLSAGLARPFPDPPLRDACGLAMAIWA